MSTLGSVFLPVASARTITPLRDLRPACTQEVWRMWQLTSYRSVASDQALQGVAGSKHLGFK